MKRRIHGDERGQVLILFVALFTVILVLGAFAIDQGLWLNHQRIAQKDADAAARAGAAKYLANLSDPMAVFSEADAGARAIATANGADMSLGSAPTFAPDCDASTSNTCGRTSCPVASGTPIAGAPSFEIAVPRPAPGLFVRALGGGDANEIGAKSTACIGSPLEVSPAEVEGIPLEIRSDEPDATDCFPGGVATGYQCSVKLSAVSGVPRGLFIVPDPTQCEGSGGGGADTIADGVVSGIDYSCSISDGGPCTSDTCVNPMAGVVGNKILTAFGDRLARTNTCAADDFESTFNYGDGTFPVLHPPGLSDPVNTSPPGTDPVNTLYATKDCFSPRTAMIILSSGDGTHVNGFAGIYIVGCFADDAPLTNVLNNCDGAGIPPGHAVLRLVIVRLMLTDSSVGGIGPPLENAPVVIQTTR